jgi:hypothetical protein
MKSNQKIISCIVPEATRCDVQMSRAARTVVGAVAVLSRLQWADSRAIVAGTWEQCGVARV